MYITIKNIKEQDKIKSNMMDRIDSFFNGEPIELEADDFSWQKPNKFFRTKTFHKELDWNKIAPKERRRLLSLNQRMRHNNSALRYLKDTDYNSMYYEFKIPKRSGGMRKIEAPDEALKEIMYIQLKYLKSLKILNHDAAWAYTEGRDVVGTMKEHTNNHSRWYLKLDLENFFGSITEDFIITSLLDVYPFTALEYINKYYYHNQDTESQEMVTRYLRNLTRLACRNGVLPQGTPLSPVLTNWIMVKYDYLFVKAIEKYRKDYNLPRMVYTRYADDIIISCKDGFNHREIIKALEHCLKDSPFKFKESKTRYASSAGRNWNLGIMCNKDNQITVGHKRKAQIKQAINNFMHNHEDWCIEDARHLLGQLSWLHKVEPEYAKGLMHYYYKKWNKNPRDLLIATIKKLNSEI